MTAWAPGIRSALCVLFAVSQFALPAGPARAEESQKISPEALRAAQTGALRDFSRLTPETLARAVSEEPPPAARRRPGLSGLRVHLNFVGGFPPPKDSFTDLAKIEFVDAFGRGDRCTGIFLDSKSNTNKTVLTAAHCGCGQLKSYRVFLGDNADAHQNQTMVLAAPPSFYSGYSCDLPPENQIGRDLVILRIEVVDNTGALQRGESAEIQYANIATMQQVFGDSRTKRLVGVGFGRTEKEERPQNAVAAIIPIQSFFCAVGFYAASACASFREFVLADPAAGSGSRPADSCGGDSGAPIFWTPPARKLTNGVAAPSDRFLVGITSRAVDGVRHSAGSSCGGGGIYTAIGHPDVVRWLALHGIFPRAEFN